MSHRYPLNAEGDFYTMGGRLENGDLFCECLSCALPEKEAPSLLAELNDDNYDTYFVKQPENQEELEQAIRACGVCCVNAVRYGGKDKDIIARTDPESCDYKIDTFGRVVPSGKRWWRIW